MAHTLIQVDAFTAKPFRGNPAAVCLLESAMPESWLQNVAAEMNLSETAFLLPEDGCFRLRWFTPTVEVDLCGHATLASAHVLWEVGLVARESGIRFLTRSGELTARAEDGWIWLDMPARRTRAAVLPPAVKNALGVSTVWEGVADHDLFVELATAGEVCGCTPDMALLRTAVDHGLIVTARADEPGLDFVSRYFAPGVGIDEDPVTGSAHCALAPYWAEHTGKSLMSAQQVSHRGGDLRVRVEPKRERVLVGGQAVTVLVGKLA